MRTLATVIEESGTRGFGEREFRNEEFNNGTIVGRRP
jgi:hypothetical protein